MSLSSHKVATPKQTAGGGFAFEDKVVAYYLVWMLAGTSPLQGPTGISRIDCQVAADGWEGLDDLLVTSAERGGLQRHAFSLKSNLQFTKDSAPASFVKCAWSLFLHRASDVVSVADDRFGLICVPHPEPLRTAIQSLLIKARRQTPAQLSVRLPIQGYVSSFERSIHDSCSCPEEFAQGLGEEARLPGNILTRMSVIELDFETLESSSEATALFVCSQLSRNGTSADAKNLWNVLCRTAQQVRGAGGGISRSELLAQVRSIAELRDLPDFAKDWLHIDTWTNVQLSAIPDSIGGTAKVYRDDVTAGAISSLQLSRFVAIVGASGTGKTVVAKRVAEESRETGNILWLKGEQMRPGYIEMLGGYRHLEHPLQEVLTNGKHKSGLVVLDSAERLLDDADFAEFCLLLHALQMDKEGSAWRLLVTCREEQWEYVQLKLIQAFGRAMPFEHTRLEYPDFETLTPIWEAFPALPALVVRPHLSHVMRNLKVLDLLASATASGRNPDAHSWIGESELIKWYWQQVVRRGKDGARRDVLLRNLASDSADAGRFETSETDFRPEDLSLVEGLYEMLGTDAERGTVFFVHDLIADWARLQVLISHEQDLASFGEHRFTNPHWHMALRLYGVLLLEADGSGEKWRSAITAHAEARDCFLESLIFAGNSQGLINNAWQVLVADEGSLLKAFLKRFQYVASIPNPQYVTLATQMDVPIEQARTWERIPLWVYWLGVLSALAGHVGDLLRLSPIETAGLSRTWLRYTPRNWPGRSEATKLALAVARQAIRTERYYNRSEDDDQLPYRALLESYSDKPDEVRELLLKAAARRVPVEADGAAFQDYEPPGVVTNVESTIFGGKRTAQEPWPDGPLYHVRSAFRAACFAGDSLRNVMTHAPDLAREIILALLIERRPPKMEPDYSVNNMLPDHAVCLEGTENFYPRFYTRGPFLLFLRINPEAALQTIIRLIDFATERWMEHHHREDGVKSGIDVPIDGHMKHFSGDREVYHWYHGVSHSEVAASALMAVEKWLYESLDKKESVDDWLDLILEMSRSAAFLGTLSEVGKYAPELFADRLRPLILVPQTYYMETIYAAQGGHAFGTPYSFREGEWFFNLARGWDAMEHRQYRLVDIAVHLFHQDVETREALSEARKQWNDVSYEDSELWHRHKETLIATFDDNNWREVQLADGSKGLVFDEPEHLKTPIEEMARNQRQMLLLTLPMTCRKMLEERKALEADQISSFLERSRQLIGFEPDDNEVARISPIANALLGTIAVLFALHRDWLRANPKEEKWCVQMLDDIVSDPPTWSEFDMPESIGSHDWEHFASDIATVIWAEDPGNRQSRRRIAHLAFAKHYSAAGILLTGAYDRRNLLGNDFWQLVNLLLDWAAVRYDLRDQRPTSKRVDFERWAKHAMKTFVAEKYATDVPRWGQQSIEKGKLWSAHNSHPRYLGREDVHLLTRIPKLDLQQVQAMFMSTLLPNQATSDWERKSFLEFWDEALRASLAGTRFFDEKGNEIDPELVEVGLPYPYDRWVLERLTVVIAQMRTEERPERYWEPVLGLGPKAEHWVEHFLSHWFMYSRKSMDKAAFVREWKSMLVFCLASETWVDKEGRSTFYAPALWLSLIGLPRFVTSLWEEKDASAIAEAGPFIARAAAHILKSAHVSVQLLSWLSEASAKGIRRLMLRPVAGAALTATEYWWKEERLAKAMAQYLGALIQDQDQASVPATAEEKAALLELVHRAARTQEPLAMELQARTASRK